MRILDLKDEYNMKLTGSIAFQASTDKSDIDYILLECDFERMLLENKDI